MDAALGAEEMVTMLTEKNLKLEERIEQMEEEKSDLVSILAQWNQNQRFGL